MAESVPPAPDLLQALLRDVSRSFYTTLRVLPSSVRRPIGLAYLLARATDTIADTEIIPVADRLRALDQLRSRILGRSRERLDFTAFTRGDRRAAFPGSTASERRLLERIEEALTVLSSFTPEDQRHIRTVLATIASGQELDLRKFATDAEGFTQVRALETDAELDDYTYRVAGCVGEFWTAMCRAHVFPQARLDDEKMLANAVRFGKGLQLVNILRDLPADLRKGRCYLPQESLHPTGLVPKDLLEPKNETRLRPAYDRWLDRADGHLRAGWAYTNSLPWDCVRVRLACAWPILIGAKTVEALRAGPVLDASQRIYLIEKGVVRHPAAAAALRAEQAPIHQYMGV